MGKRHAKEEGSPQDPTFAMGVMHQLQKKHAGSWRKGGGGEIRPGYSLYADF